MKKRKLGLGALVLMGVLAALIIAGCRGAKSDANGSEINDQSTIAGGTEVTEAVTDRLASESVYQIQIEYYEKLISDLEEKLLQSKEESFIESSQYKQTIKELEDSIKALSDKLESIIASATTPSTGNEQSKEEIKPPADKDNVDKKEEDTVDQIPDAPSHSSPTEITTSLSFEYEIKGGEITITAYKGQDASVTLPSSINGIPVTAIGEDAFRGTAIQKITLPDSITSIGWFAFADCAKLCEITVPSSVSSIGYGVFDGCSGFLVIKCEKGSYAEAFAASWGLLAITQ